MSPEIKLNLNFQLILVAVQISLQLQSWMRLSSENIYTCFPETSDKALFWFNPILGLENVMFYGYFSTLDSACKLENMCFALSKGNIYRDGGTQRHLILSREYSL